MAKRLKIAIVGPGRLGRALALGLTQAGYQIMEVVARDRTTSMRTARALARSVGATARALGKEPLGADLVWFCVPDREIAGAAKTLALAGSWQGRVALHSSGALGSGELAILKSAGASVAAVHPFMTFVSRSMPDLDSVPFAIEGDPSAARLARQLVRDLGGEPFSIVKNKKAAYHAWGAFTSPLLVSLLVTAEGVAASAGFSKEQARRWALPILRQTLANYARLGPAESFSGPIIRGDAAVVQKHLRVLDSIPAAREVYVALTKAALRKLPARNRKELQQILKPSVRSRPK